MVIRRSLNQPIWIRSIHCRCGRSIRGWTGPPPQESVRAPWAPRIFRAVRLHIIGIPSAGKTTLAKDVSSRLGIPYHSLDPVAFVDDRWTLRPVAERDAMVAGILDKPSFVTEGGVLGWTEDLFSAAD